MSKNKGADGVEGITITLGSQAHLELAELALKIQAAGTRVYKNQLAAAMINYFHANPALLKKLAITK